MATGFYQGSAEIHEFPARFIKRFPDHIERVAAEQPISYGGSWYHEEALRQAEKVVPATVRATPYIVE